MSLTEEVSGGVTYRRGEWEVSLTEDGVSGGVTEEVSGGVTYRGGEWRCHLQRR